MLTLYFIMIQYTAKNSKDEIPIGFIRELVAMCSGAQTIFAFNLWREELANHVCSYCIL